MSGILASAAKGGATGASFGGWGAIIGTVLGGLAGGIGGAGENPRDEAIKMALEKLKKELEYIKAPAFTKSEIESEVGKMNKTSRGAASVASGQIGSALSEGFGASGTPKGQPQGEIYTAAMAPVIAQGERDVVGNEQFGMDLFKDIDAQSKGRLLSAIELMLTGGQATSDTTELQRILMSSLYGMDIGAKGSANIASFIKDMNYKPIT